MSLKCGESKHRIIMENLAEIQRGYRMFHVGSISGLKNQLTHWFYHRCGMQMNGYCLELTTTKFLGDNTA